MQPLAQETYLVTVAQISVLFAGFGGVSIILNTLSSQIQRVRLRNVIMTALMLMLMSMLPLLLNEFGVSTESLWRIGTGIFGAFYILFFTFSGDLKMFRKADTVDRILISGDLTLTPFLVAATVGLFGVAAVPVFLLTIFWNLFSACAMFLMVFAPIWDEDE